MPDEPAELLLDVAIPEAKGNYGRRWELVVVVRRADGPAAIARLRISTIAREAAPAQP